MKEKIPLEIVVVATFLTVKSNQLRNIALCVFLGITRLTIGESDCRLLDLKINRMYKDSYIQCVSAEVILSVGNNNNKKDMHTYTVNWSQGHNYMK